ncbi:MAG TPA: hypothetical protein PLD20_35290 [Blastocatellia bacterium]|nr:hypothetical protein [Blastocatellia bacterium]HMV81556.1 hypothetical protein [Blastocatellia bacterium]HMX25774.1 hypothetical protein [Blastocatellia bacterium]HMY70777.1 hypothetical protein [Blastocatellia bacterium]HMZ23242.1 hypothetical protein [Blastocatellia bacterium]
METITLPNLLTAVKQLSPEDQISLRLFLNAELKEKEIPKSIEQLALEQGVRPRPFAELLGPDAEEDDDDDVDEFLNYIRGRNNGRKSIEQLMHEQGTRPLQFEEMLGDFWPEDENVDDFIDAIRELRKQTELRSLE